jgi:hypothetical protein
MSRQPPEDRTAHSRFTAHRPYSCTNRRRADPQTEAQGSQPPRTFGAEGVGHARAVPLRPRGTLDAHQRLATILALGAQR